MEPARRRVGGPGLSPQRCVHPFPIHGLLQRAPRTGPALRSGSPGPETCRGRTLPVIRRENRTRTCRITHKGIYRQLGVPNIRHRRFPDPGAYLRRLLSLDYVIEHPELEWLPTEEEKVWYCEDIGISTAHLPKRIYTGVAGAVTRYFPLKLPVAGGPTSTFVYVDPGNDTSTEMQHWGRAHEHLWAGMRERNIKIHVAAIGVNPDADKRARAVLDGWALEEKRVAAGSP